MCWPNKVIPTNEHGKATRLWICHCQAIQIRVFHLTWLAFFLCFFGWFATANLYPQIAADLKLTIEQKAIAGGCSVASTVFFRVFVGWFSDKIGPRKAYTLLLILSAFPICGMALVQSPLGYIIVSFLIGIVGASFVITNVHIISMFAGKIVGTANATATGWGNFGGGVASVAMPLLYKAFVAGGSSNAEAWRLSMLVPGISLIVFGILYYVLTTDHPPSPKSNAENNSGGDIDERALTVKDEPKGGLIVGASDYRTWILFFVYFVSFGVELTVLRFCVSYFIDVFGLAQEVAGVVILAFSFCNLFARSIGGAIADLVSRFSEKSLEARVRALFCVLLFEAIFLIAFSVSELAGLGYAICMLVMFSLGVQAAEGATFAIVPFVQPKAVGPVAGIVGAGGNTGAMLYAFVLFTQVPQNISYLQAWLVMGIGTLIVAFLVLCIKFSDEEIKAADETMNTWTQIQMDAEKVAADSKRDSQKELVERTEIAGDNVRV